jgi:mono/diheme cytochrome c family protein
MLDRRLGRWASWPGWIVGLLLVAAGLCQADEPPAAPAKVDFTTQIQPLLRKHCYTCHGPEQQEGGLRLDVKERALQGGDRGAAIVPHKSGESWLIRAVTGQDEALGRMPPDGKAALTPEEIDILRAWVDQGAPWSATEATAASTPRHWSLVPPADPPLPAVRHRVWLQQPVDAFILARQEAEGVRPSPPASRDKLVRRLFLDLIGLPPTPEEVRSYLDDAHPDATERLVDRLLASPHFGERWGRWWLDLARYADSDGYEKDRPRPFAFHYRDWVIAALNADMPYDQFTVEQLAGDLLPEAGIGARIAVGLHRNTLHNTEGGIDPEEDRVKKTVDRTNTLGTIWLGLTVGCTQCHSHKYDPLSQREYYRLYAFFNDLDERDLEIPTPEEAAALAQARQQHAEKQQELRAALEAYIRDEMPGALASWEASLAGLDASALAQRKIPPDIIAILARPPQTRTAAEQDQLSRYYRRIDPKAARLEKAVRDHEAKAPQLPPHAKAQSVVATARPRVTRIHQRGDFLSPGDEVSPGTPEVLPPLVARGERPDRLDLARWLMDPAHPLTARVAVNRLWYQLLGRGIVPTLDDFGKQGDPPSHPELLDWLARELVRRGWSQKAILRMLVTSATYQQASTPRQDLIQRDPENVLFARYPRRRVEAEIVRDLALACAGLLTDRIGGPSVRPPQPAEYASITYANSARWEESRGADRYRRGLYTFFQRTSPYPMLMTFDAPDSTECTVRRQTSNTPLQALTLLNDVVFFEAAQALGRRIIAEVPAEQDPAQSVKLRTEHAFWICLARPPTAAELDAVARLHADSRTWAASAPEQAQQLVGPQPLSSDPIEEVAAWVSVARALLNLDEFLTRE